MRLEEEFVGQRAQFAEWLRKVAEQVQANALTVRGRQLPMPDAAMEYKMSYKFDLGENKLSLSIEWLDRNLP